MTPLASLPADRLAVYLRARGLADSDPLRIMTLRGGQSNPTFLVQCGSNKYVLRKKPPGVLLASAHAIHREYQIMNALRNSDVPVPRMHHYCEDATIIGTPFYLMEYLKGRVFVDQSLPTLTRCDRRNVYDEMNRILAALHRVNYTSIRLENFGRAGNYFSRQIARWGRQVQELPFRVNDAMQQLLDWLPEHIPRGDETTLVHGDFRLDNLVFDSKKVRVIGVLDWELSTLGHPLADLSNQCMSWHIPHQLWRGIGGLDLDALGIPEEKDYLAMYARRTGRSIAKDWNFYLAYSFFRMAAILYGIAARAAGGNAAADDAVTTGAKAGPLAELGWRCALQPSAQHRGG